MPKLLKTGTFIVFLKTHMKKCAYSCLLNHKRSGNCIKSGFYIRKSDSKKIQRYRCLSCKKSFSSATHTDTFGQNKRRLNSKVYELLVSGVSQRRAAKLLRIHRITVVRKFRFMARKLSLLEEDFSKVSQIQFDHMETSEHSKLKPLSILVVVDKESRRILRAKVSSMPAKGLLTKKSMKKYGKRIDDRMRVMREEFSVLKEELVSLKKIESDESPLYPGIIGSYFQGIEYKRYKGRRGCVTGQGELKRGGKDPLFSLNHTCAMFRANVNRLFRRSWCTTKKMEQLQLHLDLYKHYHNRKLIS